MALQEAEAQEVQLPWLLMGAHHCCVAANLLCVDSNSHIIWLRIYLNKSAEFAS